MGMGHMMGGMGFIGMILDYHSWLVILWCIYINCKSFRKPKGVRSDDSLQILKERLAQGEINEDEYEKLKKVLKRIRIL